MKIIHSLNQKSSKMATVSLSNFTKQNTPSIFQKIGNICLIIATIGGAAALAPISAPVVVTIGAWAAFAGTLGKILTKMTGTEEVTPAP